MRGERVAVVVVDEVLVEHAADPLHDAARDLPVDDHRVDDDAAVLAHDVTQDRHDCRCWRRPRTCRRGTRSTNVYSGPRERRSPRDRAGCRSGAAPAASRRLRDLGEVEYARRAATEIRRRRSRGPRAPPPAVAGDLEDLRAHGLRGQADHVATDHRVAAPARAAPKGAAAVSPWTSTTSSMSTPRWSATTWTIVVSRLWPVESGPINTCTVPVGSMRTVVASVPTAGAAIARRLHVEAECRSRGTGRPARAAACSRRERVVVEERRRPARACRRGVMWSRTMPVGACTGGPPDRSTLRRRSSSGSMPSRRRDVDHLLAGHGLDHPRAAVRRRGASCSCSTARRATGDGRDRGTVRR